MPRLIAIAVVEHDDQFLVGQRPAGVPLESYWEFPGGKVEDGETPEAAAIRECLEETGLRVRVIAQYNAHVHQYEHATLDLRFFRCVPESLDLSPRPPYCWVSRTELATLKFPAGNRELLRLLQHPSH